MTEQLHKRFVDEQVKELLEKYITGEIELKYVLEILRIKRRRFFRLLQKYREGPKTFSIAYQRKKRTRSIKKEIERNILKELQMEKRLIEDKEIPVKKYNYSYVKDQIWKKYQQEVSIPTIINRAKKYGFYLKKRERKVHEREVLTNYPGQLIQHDTSYHRWSPYVEEKWCLIISLDDYSRKILYAQLVEKELSWEHILALESVILQYGLPLCYYVDSHRIFRFVQGRDSFWRRHYKVTDEAAPQWKQVLTECGVKIIYALSPQAKGKVERPYGWLQDRIVRTCAREGIKEIKDAREVLRYEVDRYNNHQVHSTTGEIPSIRFNKALSENKTLFRTFVVPPPYQSTKDIFCLRANRIVNSYRKISINNLEIKVQGVHIGDTV
ncbi:MAG: hypothetical protein NC932_01815, partial [Candidatus Omnitrophica bacterium]|nr:hypothetical protein [Candidatus Omnitrophota bacterium]